MIASLWVEVVHTDFPEILEQDCTIHEIIELKSTRKWDYEHHSLDHA